MKKGKVFVNIVLTCVVSIVLVYIARMSQTTDASVEIPEIAAEVAQALRENSEVNDFQKYGQVIITNIDSSDKTVTIDGATIKIVNKDTDVEFLEVISLNGTLEYSLPFGEYVLMEVKPAVNYLPNEYVYEFELISEDGNNLSLHTLEIELVSEMGSMLMAENVDVVKTNPKTSDNSIFKLVSAVVLTGFLIVAILAHRKISKKMYL